MQKPGGASASHWRDDDGWTLCGRRVVTFDVLDELEVETIGDLPSPCAVCEELQQRATPTLLASLPALYSEPKRGRLYKTGPLYHGTKTRRWGESLR